MPRPASTLLLLFACTASAPPVPPDSPAPVDVPTTTPVAADDPAAPQPVPSDSTTAPPADPPTEAPPVPPASPSTPDLLGQPRAAVTALLGPRQYTEGRWHHHAAADVQYDKGRCVRVRRTAPTSLDCLAIPAWAGYPNTTGFPLRHTSGCDWPGVSDRHRLAPDIAAHYDPTTGRFEAWLLD